jgi:hypothetical protein
MSALINIISVAFKNGDLPLHILCQNEEITRDSLHLVLQTYPAGVHILAKVCGVITWKSNSRALTIRIL